MFDNNVLKHKFSINLRHKTILVEKRQRNDKIKHKSVLNEIKYIFYFHYQKGSNNTI